MVNQLMNDTWKILKLGVYVFTLPLVATAAASAHQWMTGNTTLAIAPALPVAVTAPVVPRMTAVRNHTVTINEAGEVQGRVAAISHKTKAANGIAQLTIYFVQNGEVAQKGTSNDDGTFVIKGLDEGIYSFVAVGEFSFATCGVNVVRSRNGENNYLEIAAITPNVKAVHEIIENELPESIRKEIERDLTAVNVQPGQVVGTNRVELDGTTLKGTVVSLLSDDLQTPTKAHLFRGSKKAAEFVVEKDGSFSVDDVEPGVYDFVVVGPDGLAAVSFEAVSPDEALTDAYTAVQETLLTNFVVAMAPQVDGGFIGGCCGGSDAVVYGSPSEFVGDNLGGGIAGGGCCGGASNFSGFSGGCGGCCGGRFGGLLRGGLLLPLLAAGVAIPLSVSSSSPTVLQ
jgi:hypothetical protein